MSSGEGDEEWKGWVAVFGAIIFFGSYAVFVKTKKVQEADIPPIVIQLYSSLGVFLSGWVVLAWASFEFSWYGVLGACLWAPSQVFAIHAINTIGYAVAPAIWSGLTIIVAFIWGTFVFDDDISNWALAISGVALLCVGIVGAALCKTAALQNLLDRHSETSRYMQVGLLDEGDDSRVSSRQKLEGYVSAIIMGVMNGSLLVPNHYYTDVDYVISFGIGAIMITPLMFLGYCAKIKAIPYDYLQMAALPGIGTGILWNVGNVCSIYAIMYLNYSVGYPLTQVCLIVGSMWAIFFYKEMTDKRIIIIFFIFAAIVIAGASMLGTSGNH